MDSFKYLLIPELEALRQPSFDCVDNVFNHLDTLAGRILGKLFSRFPELLPEILDISH